MLEESRALTIGTEMWYREGPGMASALLHFGERERALATAREGAAANVTSGAQLTELQRQIELAEVAARCGHEAESRAALARAYDLAAKIECKGLVPSIHEAAATLAAELKEPKQQLAELREAHRLYQELGATGHAERLARALAALDPKQN